MDSLPHLPDALRGRRLVFEQGVYALAFLAGGLLILFWRHNGSLSDSSPLCGWRISGVHAIAGRNGHALEESRGAGFREKHVRERARRDGNRSDRDRCIDCKIYRRRVDHHAADSRPDSVNYAGRQTTLQSGCTTDTCRQPRSMPKRFLLPWWCFLWSAGTLFLKRRCALPGRFHRTSGHCTSSAGRRRTAYASAGANW